MKEIWKDVVGYEGLYQVSNTGKIKALFTFKYGKGYIKSERLVKGWNNRGYHSIGLTKNKEIHNYYVHRLVAMAFIPNPNNKPYVNHIDYNPLNCNADNLEWCTQKENVNWSKKHMCHRKTKAYSNTGERYISFRKTKNLYRVIIDKKEHTVKTLEEAIKLRDKLLLECE